MSAPDAVTFISAGAITDSNGGANNITATTANLTAGTNIGTAVDPIETDVAILNATSGGGGVFITEANAVTINNVVAAGGNIVVSNTTGDMTINTLTASTGGIDLTATAGSILDGNGAANNLTAAADSALRAMGGVVGLSTDPVEVNINPGILGVAATGQIAGVSVDIDGTVLPSNTLTILNSPSGQVIFNGNILNPPAAPPINVGNATSAIFGVNPQRLNEEQSSIETLLNSVDDLAFESEAQDCELVGRLAKEGQITRSSAAGEKPTGYQVQKNTQRRAAVSRCE